MILLFPFLIGRIRTKARNMGWYRLSSVSIPHRQDKNEVAARSALGIYLVFPFLIGRIRTYFELRCLKKGGVFPFLIGRIRTWSKHSSRCFCRYLFPFLIGRIRTQKYSNVFEMRIIVSIPHRQDKNILQILIMQYCKPSFHSSQVG